MKFSDYKGEQALDVLADMIEPASEIFGDEEIRKYMRGDGAEKRELGKAARLAIKNHKNAVIELLAALEQEKPEEYVKKISVLTLPVKFLEIISDKELLDFFRSQGQTTEETSFGSATENTGATEA